MAERSEVEGVPVYSYSNEEETKKLKTTFEQVLEELDRTEETLFYRKDSKLRPKDDNAEKLLEEDTRILDESFYFNRENAGDLIEEIYLNNGESF